MPVLRGNLGEITEICCDRLCDALDVFNGVVDQLVLIARKGKVGVKGCVARYGDGVMIELLVVGVVNVADGEGILRDLCADVNTEKNGFFVCAPMEVLIDPAALRIASVVVDNDLSIVVGTCPVSFAVIRFLRSSPKKSC